MAFGYGRETGCLTGEEAQALFAQGLDALDTAGKRVLVILPDATRSGPVAFCFSVLAEWLLAGAAQVDFLIALGTHAPMSEDALQRHLGITREERAGRWRGVGIYQHDWRRDLVQVATIPAAEVQALTGGLLQREVPVRVNARLLHYDQLLVCGPVFPHEAAGFSGGNKYFFPGVSGPEMIDTLHWLSALMTNLEIVGRKETPVRRLIDAAASRIPVPRACFSMVTTGAGDLAGLYFGTPEESQAAAADLSERVHVVERERPFRTVLAVMPPMYEDLWTAAKGMYKTEPVAAAGGTVILYAPHVHQFSQTHGALIERVGYHVRDYFLAHWEEVRNVPPVVLAHSTLVKGSGTYEGGIEKPRVSVVLATGIPRERCERVNLGYLDPAAVRVEEWTGREEEGILVVPHAGESLYRLRP